MALPLYIPLCIHTSTGRYHLPPSDQPLRIQIEDPLIAIRRFLPHISWRLDFLDRTFPHLAGPELARLTYQTIYGRDVSPKVLADDINPEVLQTNIIEIGNENENDVYANIWLSFVVEPTEFIGKKVPAVPRCCHKREGTQDR
ncbi:unnamed protein product [Penicillium nalgiovense]|nr:unnamed protein product [Penicillium nalgiovense]